MINNDKKVHIPICIYLFIQICITSLAAMEPTPESAIYVSSSLALKGSTNLQYASSSTEDINLSHDAIVNLNNQTEVNVEEKDGKYGSIGVSPKKNRVISQLFYPEFQLKMQANRYLT